MNGINFDILDRKLELKRHCLLEASAGTGKTFSIENLVVRLLLEVDDDPITIDQFLIVTFTRAAARELKGRIYSKIVEALNQLSDGGAMPDYLQAYYEGEESELWIAKNALQRALATFDDASITTIHAFCARMLMEQGFEGEVSAHSTVEPEKRLHGVVKDFFRTQTGKGSYSQAQLERVLRDYRGDPQRLAEVLAKTVSRGVPVEGGDPFSTQFAAFQAVIQQIWESWNPNPEKTLHDFERLASGFTKTCDRQGNILPSIRKNVEAFTEWLGRGTVTVEDFDLLICEGLMMVSALDPSRQKKRAKPTDLSSLCYPGLIEELRERLLPIVESARSTLSIFARMAQHCQKLHQRVVEEEEVFGPDDLLRAMKKACEQERFVGQVRQQFQAAIIDEFQDTDPVQWKIFETLFLNSNWKGFFYLVGDPKQSIYAFRNADVYTYIAAKEKMGHLATLNTNYRSTAPLVNALNVLLGEKNCSELIALPRKGIGLVVPPVLSHIDDKGFIDDLGSIHFVAVQGNGGRSRSWPTKEIESNFFPFIAQEIQRLEVDFNDCAVLVRDRFQANRLIRYLEKIGMPVVARRSAYLEHSFAVPALRELLQAIIQPRRRSLLHVALGGPLIGWTNEQICELDQRIENIIQQVWSLNRQLLSQGFCAFFQAFLNSCWTDDGQSVEERLLSDIDLYTDLHHLAELLTAYQSASHASPEELVTQCKQIETGGGEDKEQLLLRRDPGASGVNVVTLHLSKGLEYDVVFALGLINRTPQKEDLSLVDDGQTQKLIAAPPGSLEYDQYCEELDAEKMRQLYVAMTRAKRRLYNFIIFEDKPKPVVIGTASPMELFLAKAGENTVGYSGLYARIDQGLQPKTKELFHRLQTEADITYQELVDQDQPSVVNIKKKSTPNLCCPKRISIPGDSIHVSSFSAITSGSSKIIGAPHDYGVEDKSIHTLPAGAETGVRLHRLFEKIPLGPHGPEDVPQIVKTLGFPEEWESVIIEMVDRVWTAPLLIGSDTFCLADVDKEKVFRETEFLFSNVKQFYINEAQLLKGFVDMVFEYNGKYFILDWKSNWLGPDDSYYTQLHLEQAMEHHHYPLQAKIYKEAWKRYVALFDDRPFEECFGGAFYLFVRGQGIYHFWP